jgi:hypothetical protein
VSNHRIRKRRARAGRRKPRNLDMARFAEINLVSRVNSQKLETIPLEDLIASYNAVCRSSDRKLRHVEVALKGLMDRLGLRQAGGRRR